MPKTVEKIKLSGCVGAEPVSPSISAVQVWQGERGREEHDSKVSTSLWSVTHVLSWRKMNVFGTNVDKRPILGIWHFPASAYLNLLEPVTTVLDSLPIIQSSR